MPSFKAWRAQFNLPLKFWLVAAIAFINSVSFTIIIPTLYPYAKQFGLSDFHASLLITSYAISQFIATPILGRLSDFLGRKPLLVVSLFGTVIANLLASVAPVAALLFLARILDGLTGGNMSIARAVISDSTRPEQRAHAFGLFDAAFRLGFVTGPAIAYFAQQLPPLPGVSSLGMSFLAGAAIALVATLLSAIWLPETLAEREPLRLSWQMFGFGRLVRSLGRPRLGRIYLMTFLSGFTFTIFTFAFQPFFLNVLNQEAPMVAAVFVIVGVAGVLTQLLAVGPLTKRFNLVDILAVAIALRALIFFCIPLFPFLWAFLLGSILLGIANTFPLPLLNALLSVNSGEREQGEVLGINASYLSISNALGPAIAGLLVSLSYSTPFWVTSVLTLLTAGFALRLKSSLADPEPTSVRE
ncbi:MAG: MFS transporter [Spirulinaceae cyanobacterium RM2_2_10]|nr:MFS transporter [Spirulinaceae cyanobacterium SM2_1_0]NJO19417.1 MFS transporter [Spirulinaceae cyanobacterium RM2_2_10]